MYFLLGMIVGLAVVIVGSCLGLVLGYAACYATAVKNGRFEWMGRKYRVTSDGPVAGDDAIKDIIKEQFKASTFDVDIERAMRRNAARKGE